MIVLSDEPKTLVMAAEYMLNLSPNIRKNFTIDELAFRLNEYIRELRHHGTDTSFIGTSGFYIFYFVEDGMEEIKVMLDVADFHRYAGDDVTQQFVHTGTGALVYDDSCPSDWLEEDGEV